MESQEGGKKKMNLEQREKLLKSLLEFVVRVSSNENASPAEIAALPEIARLLCDASSLFAT